MEGRKERKKKEKEKRGKEEKVNQKKMEEKKAKEEKQARNKERKEEKRVKDRNAMMTMDDPSSLNGHTDSQTSRNTMVTIDPNFLSDRDSLALLETCLTMIILR